MEEEKAKKHKRDYLFDILKIMNKGRNARIKAMIEQMIKDKQL